MHSKHCGLQGEEEANVHLLQTVWCRYAGQEISQPTNIWSASLSNLAAAQALEQQQARQQQEASQLPSFNSKLEAQHPVHVSPKDLVQDQLRLHMPETYLDIALPPPGPSQDVWSKVAWIQNSQASVKSVQQDLQASVKSVQQELAELFGGSQVEGSTAYDMGSRTEQPKQPQQPADWAHMAALPALPAMHSPADYPADRSMLPLSPTASAELSQFMSWSQLDSPDKAQHKQQQQQHLPLAPTAAPHACSSPMSPLGVVSDALWLQQNTQAPARLDTIPPTAQLTHGSDSMAQGNTLGLGQYALDAAAGLPAHLPPSQGGQPAVPEWLQAVQAETARAVRPRRSTPQDFHPPGDVPRLPFYSSASHAGREDSGDLSTTVGTQLFMGRVASSGTQGRSGARDGGLTSMASPKSSLGSSLPSLAQVRSLDIGRKKDEGWYD